jgi:glycosyltransferase involved in cell wall biosynthesis
MKIYISNIQGNPVGGGWTFLRNFTKGIKPYAEITDRFSEADIILVAGITMVDREQITQAKELGKKVILRVDNVPRKSRNRRSTPHERLQEIAKLADGVIYQSQWAKWYCAPLCGEGEVILNGVDQSIFHPPITTRQDLDLRPQRYLFAYHGKNELKGFWQAHFAFQKYHRLNNNAEFWFIYDFGRDLDELQHANFDFWNGEKFTQYAPIDDPHRMADLMRQCRYLIYPAVSDAAPNMVLEARACGLEVLDYSLDSGTKEMLDCTDISLDRMCNEYFNYFKKILYE